MRTKCTAILTLLLLTGMCQAEFKIEGSAQVPRDKMIRLSATGAQPKSAIVWRYDKKKLDGGKSGDGSKLWLVGPPGVYLVEAMALRLDATGTTVVEESEITVTVGDAPAPGPGPGPGPGPAPDPAPGPAPIPGAGLRVLMVYESAGLAKLPAGQSNVLYSKSIREYLDSKCPTGDNGTTKEWRIWDKDVDASNESKGWQDALKRPRKQTPWIIISNGKLGYEGPLPASVDDALTLLKKYGG